MSDHSPRRGGRSVGAVRVRGFDGAFLRKKRTELGRTLGWLSAVTGLSMSHISALERGESSPDPSALLQLAEALGVQPSDLVTIPEAARTLADWRVLAGLTQKSAAQQLQVAPSWLSHIETGHHEPPDDLVAQMATMYGTPKDVLRKAWDAGRRNLLED